MVNAMRLGDATSRDSKAALVVGLALHTLAATAFVGFLVSRHPGFVWLGVGLVPFVLVYVPLAISHKRICLTLSLLLGLCLYAYTAALVIMPSFDS